MAPTETEIQRFWSDTPMIHPGYGFDRRSASPEEIFTHVERIVRDKGRLFQEKDQPLLSRYIDYAGLRGKRVLEIGYGVGWLLHEFACAGADVHGIDLSESHFRYSSHRFREHPNVNLQIASAEEIPYPDDHFDFVASYGVLHHAADDRRCYAELHRVLKPGGRAFLMLYRKGGPKYWVRKVLWQGLVGGGLRRHHFDLAKFIYSVTDAYEGEGAPISRHYTRRDLKALFGAFRQARFRIAGNSNEWDDLPHPRLPLSNVLPSSIRHRLVTTSGAYWMVDLEK